MRRYIFICILIVLSMILCPVAAIGNGSLQPVIAEEQIIEVIAVSDEGEYITVMSSSSGEASKIEMREYLIGCVAAEMPANYHPEALKAQAAASLSHQNIVSIFDVGVEDNLYYILSSFFDIINLYIEYIGIG